MQLLICAATQMELKTIQGAVAKKLVPPARSIKFLITGVGLLPSMYTITKYLVQHKPGFVIQAGIAGALHPQLLPGETVVVSTDTVADAGVVENKQFRNLFDMELQDPDCFPWAGGMLANPYTDWLSFAGLKKVRGITVNEISTDPKRIQQYQLRWGAQTESMEGAALHYACLQEGIPFLQIRAVSNIIGERDKSKWKLGEAVNSLNAELAVLVDKILEL